MKAKKSLRLLFWASLFQVDRILVPFAREKCRFPSFHFLFLDSLEPLAHLARVLFLGLVGLSQIAYIALLCIAFVISFGSIVLLETSIVKFKYPYGAIDWTFDRLQLSPGDKLEITLANLSNKMITYEKDSILWKITKDGQEKQANVYASELVKKP